MATTTNAKKKTNMPNYLGDYMSGNYTPGYDYVSNYYNPNSGYYNPSVYGYRGNRYNVPTNAGFSMQMKDNDNYWNLGSMLGGLWGVQYNKRGAEKAGKEADAMLQEEYNRLMGVEQPKQPTAGDQMYDMAQKAGAIPERQAELKMPGQEQTPKAEDLGKGPKYTDQQGNIVGPQTPDYKGVKLGFLDKKYGLVSGQQHDNPEGDKKVGTQAGQAVGGDISKIDVTKLPQGFNSDLLRANIISKLKAAGRNDWQISQAMQGIEPQLLGKQREYNDKAFGSLYQQYGQLIQNGQIDDAGMVLAKMKQFNPEQASLLEKQYERAAGKKLKMDTMEDNIALYKKYFPNMSDQEIGQMILRGGKTTPSGRSTTASGDIYGSGGGWTKDKAARRKDLLDFRQKELAAGRQFPAHMAKLLEELDAEYYGFTKATNGNGDKNGNGNGNDDKPDPYNNWDSITKFYEDVLNGKLGENYEGIARKHEGRGLYGNDLAKMIRDLGKQRAQEQEEREESNPLNKVEALNAARRAGLYVDTWTGRVSPAGPYDTPTEKQNTAYQQWKEKHSRWA